ncbi:hypothetical protein GIY23_05465 [Allosaccharopolyspora coralli]|uniref:Uncharacterized protein n=1 Tax=Allosaccharopolyspora coralli TaxID=2665642 RepID=A0A5Q3Q385_9PSEU|nr:hypothetical protein [Allosaccharopolyspora coralli]QGK69058.1 hypothetical protein GIY23_05465 [Allosaccharopolyspora coralli]
MYEYTPHRPGRDPEPPAGQGPLLECHYTSPHVALVATGISAVVIFLGTALATGGFDFVTYWYLDLFVLAGLALLYRSTRRDYLAAGAEWLQTRRGWVNTYKLAKVKYLSVPAGFIVRLADNDGRVVACSIYDLQGNPALWDLVYNGLCHSLANHEVQTNWVLRRHLPLPTFTDKPPGQNNERQN